MKSTGNDQSQSSASRRMLNPQVAPDFSDSTLEWRRMFAETWGTFLLVLVAAVVRVLSGGSLSLAMIVVAPGLMVMAIIYFMGTVSGAHLNPAVTLAFALRGNFPWRRVPGYLAAQLVGGISAAVFLRAMFGKAGALGATVPGIGIGGAKAMAMEASSDSWPCEYDPRHSIRRAQHRNQRCPCSGAYIALAGLWASPISGASMNPVRSLAPDLVRGDFNTSWIYLIGPILGALLGVCFEWILRGKPTSAGAIAAQGILDEGSE